MTDKTKEEQARKYWDISQDVRDFYGTFENFCAMANYFGKHFKKHKELYKIEEEKKQFYGTRSVDSET